MSRRGGTQIPDRSSWPRLGLLIVLLVLGHDVLMASEARALPHRSMATGHQLMPRPAPSADVAPQHSAPGSGHPENCRIGLSAMLTTVELFSGAHQGVPLNAVGTGLSLLPRWSPGDVAWPAPHWPPSRLRALFQVYRL
jgi:hypothetical protein